MPSRTWVKIYCDKWLGGTIREETPLIRSVWVDLLTLAGSGRYGDTGIIQLAENVGLTDEQISAVIKIPINQWLESKEQLSNTKRISFNGTNVIRILNWNKYQSEYERQRSYREKLQLNITPNSYGEKEKEKEKEKENIKRKNNYIIYGEFSNVLLTKIEYEKLIKKFGEKETALLIEKLSSGIESKGYKYKSHYAAILTWERREKEKGLITIPLTPTEDVNNSEKYIKGKYGHMVQR